RVLDPQAHPLHEGRGDDHLGGVCEGEELRGVERRPSHQLDDTFYLGHLFQQFLKHRASSEPVIQVSPTGEDTAALRPLARRINPRRAPHTRRPGLLRSSAPPGSLPLHLTPTSLTGPPSWPATPPPSPPTATGSSPAAGRSTKARAASTCCASSG